jgi:hypothetical protein
MAAQPLLTIEPTHFYHADADVLSANLVQPLEHEIKRHAYVKLPKDGQYQFKRAEAFRLEGIISYESGYTQVAGHRSTKAGHGFTTLTTAVVEGLNVLDVVTADRVVGQISTEHPLDGQVPSVTFLGTRFDNLRIGGHKVDIDRNLEILGPKPANDKSYFDDPGVMSRFSQQYSDLRSARSFPEWADEQYRWNPDEAQRRGEARCSLVNSVAGAPGNSFGHVIDVPHFGKIFLAELTVNREKARSGVKEPDKYTFHLAMVRLELGCLAQGNAQFSIMDSNGQGSGDGHHP